MKKLFTLLTMLVICISGMWAEDVVPRTDFADGAYFINVRGTKIFYDATNSNLQREDSYRRQGIFTLKKGTGAYSSCYTIQIDGKHVTYSSTSENNLTFSTSSDATNSNKWWVIANYKNDSSTGKLAIYPYQASIATTNGAWNLSKTVGGKNQAVGFWNGTDDASYVNLYKIEEIKVSDEPTTTFAANTTWYTIKNHTAGNYLHDNGNETTISLNRTSTSYSAKDLFCFVGDSEHGYKIYNMAAGVNKILSSSTTMGSGFESGDFSGPWPVMTELTNGNVPDGYNTTWDLTKGETISGEIGFLFTQHGTTDHTLNARGGLGYWNGSGNGSTMRIAEVTFADLVEYANNLLEGEHAGYVGFHTNAANNTLQAAVTTAEAVEIPQSTDFETLVTAVETFTSSSTVTLEQGKYYRFVSASTAKSGYVVSANSDNKLIWEAEDDLDEKQFWKVTWLNNNKIEATFMNVGTNMYPQGKTADNEQFELGATATNTNIVALGSGQYNIKPNNQKSMHVAGWKTSDTTGNIISWNNTVIGDPSAWYISEIEKYNIEITGNSESGRIIINGNEYANGSKFYCPKNTEFTPTAKIISYYHAGDISISENTISLDYTEITVPDGYNGYIGGNTDISETEWKTEEYWCLASGASWNVGPGYHDSGMWQPIYLQDVTATGIEFEGWGLQLKLVNSSLTAKTTKIQSNWTINVAEDSELELTMTSSDSHPDNGTHTFNINGNMTINAKPYRFNGTKVSDNRVNIGENGHFKLISSSNLSINNSASFTINVTPTEPTKYNEVLSQEEPFAVIQNVTFADGKLTFGKIDPNNKWTKVDENALLHQTVPGNYYSIVETTETGTKKYYLHTYKYNSIYSRNVTSGNFGSICLPNGASVSDLTDTGIEKVLKVTSVETDRVVMDEVEEMTAGVPYIFKSNKNTISLTVTGESVANPVNNTQTYLVGNFGTPVYVPMSDENNSYYVLQSNQFKKVTSANSIKSGSNRCYLKVPATSQSRLSTLGISVDEDGATGIDALNALINNNAEIYDINGRKLKDLRKGINIVNGVKVLVK